ncbi:hypothetical protein AB4Y30_03885 [Ornithinibacillus sp. 4-3]|uniref:Uncharacterized protein n=1 Tax=Ornithinibacillus sp. 4-3 TaxID=3231488 RepID=A0AB39HT48_9BACI
MAGLMVQEGNELQGKETLISVTIEVKQAGYSAGVLDLPFQNYLVL